MFGFVVARHLPLGHLCVAQAALKIGLASMSVHVLFLVRNLIKRKAAALHRADKGLLPSVNSEVVEQVVPLPKDLAAEGVIA